MKCFRMSLITITHASAYTAQHQPEYLFVFDVSEVSLLAFCIQSVVANEKS